MALQRNLKALGTFGLSDHGPPQPGLHPVHSAHAPLRPGQPRAPAASSPGCGSCSRLTSRSSGRRRTDREFSRQRTRPFRPYALRDLDASLPRRAARAGPPGRDRRLPASMRSSCSPLAATSTTTTPAAVAGLRGGWRRPAELSSVHAPIADRLDAGAPRGQTLSNAASDRATAAGGGARGGPGAASSPARIPFEVLVVHLGTPAAAGAPGDNHRARPPRSVEEICRAGGAARRPGRLRGDSERAVDAGGAGHAARARPRGIGTPASASTSGMRT